MSDKWLSGSSSESGILRKTTIQIEKDDLLIFGYACKIFRDEEKAKFIDQGKHLIPWMGNDSLKIDRYDVRAALTDISQYEPPQGGYTNRLDYLTPDEQRAEQLCEEERYFSLYNNELEEEQYQEEELKRLHKDRSAAYGQVAFNYDNEKQSSEINVSETKDEEVDEVYVPHPSFIVPPDIELPTSLKLHVIIEKTAKFIASQGAQMEILIKAKQSNNPQFEFLNQNNRLNRYYKHLLNAIKTNTYPLEELNTREEHQQKLQNDNNNLDNLDKQQQFTNNYANNQPPVHIPVLKYQPSADCAYTQLISKIKGLPIPSESLATTLTTPLATTTTTTITTSSTTISNMMPSSIDNTYDYGMYLNSYGGGSTITPTNNIVLTPTEHSTAITATNVQSTATALILAPPPPPPPPQVVTSAINILNMPSDKIIENKDEIVEVKKISSGLMLAQYYNTDSESENDDADGNVGIIVNQTDRNENSKVDKESIEDDAVFDKLDIPKPSNDLKHIIDKTAAYVLKNGKEFEDILRTKNDARFSFLCYTDQYYRYYMYKVAGVICPTINNVNVTNATEGVCNNRIVAVKQQMLNSEAIEPKVITPVSFSIKTKEEAPMPIIVKPVLPQEPSSDEEDTVENNGSKPTNNHKSSDVNNESLPIPLPISSGAATVHLTSHKLIHRNISDLLLANKQQSSINYTISSSCVSSSSSITSNTLANRLDTELSETNIRDLILEPTSELDGRKEARKAEDKVKDRLAQVAREKLGLISKEKQLQIDRRKRAMAFINHIKNVGGTTALTQNSSKLCTLISEPSTSNDTKTVPQHATSLPSSSSSSRSSSPSSLSSIVKIIQSPEIDRKIVNETNCLKSQIIENNRFINISDDDDSSSGSISKYVLFDDSDIYENGLKKNLKRKSRSRSVSRTANSRSKTKSRSTSRIKSKSRSRSKLVSRSKSRSRSGSLSAKKRHRHRKSKNPRKKKSKRKSSRSRSRSKHREHKHKKRSPSDTDVRKEKRYRHD